MAMQGLVSVIVPVYNVEQYLNTCMESIVGQSYPLLEIILVNDGSTDNSGQLCEEWEEKDRRVRVIVQNNQGLAGARNTGVRSCQGEYFVFVDSDDWIAPDYVEHLYHAVRKENADLAVCNFYHVADGKERYCQQKVKGHIICDTEQKKDFLVTGHTCMWSKIYKRDFYVGENLEIPGICYEDLAMFPLLVFLSEKIVCIDEGLYYYRADRDGSIMNDDKNIGDFSKALEFGIGMLRERSGHTDLDRHVLLLSFFNARFMINRELDRGIPKDRLELFQKNVETVWDRYFADWRECLPQNLIAFGSFNTRWCVHRMLLNREKMTGYYGFTGLIAQFMGEKKYGKLEHENKFRSAMIRQDWEQDFAEVLRIKKADYIFLDLMEEVKNSIIVSEEGEYLTDSEALREAGAGQINRKRTLSCENKEYITIWKQACDRFIEITDRFFDRRRVVLIQMRYAKWYYEDGERKEFPNQKEISMLNDRISEMERYILDKGSGIAAIEIPDELFFNKDDRYAKNEYYLNGDVYNFVVRKWFNHILL